MPTEASEKASPIIPANPVVVVQGVGHLSREFMREVGSLFWFMVLTLEETVERIREGRVPFRATSFFRHCERSEEHTSELQSQSNLVCRLLLEKKKPPWYMDGMAYVIVTHR